MRRAGRIVAGTIERVLAAVRPNVTTAELDSVAEEYIREQGATPSFKGYGGGAGAGRSRSRRRSARRSTTRSCTGSPPQSVRSTRETC